MIIRILSISTLAALLAISGASAAVIGSVSLSPAIVSQGGSLNISGSCGLSGANGVVNIAVTSGSVSQTAAVTADANGVFSVTMNVSATFPTGSASVTATCPNGDTLTGTLFVNPADPNATLVVANNNPARGNEIRFSGICGTTPGGQVEIAIVANGVRTVIGRVITGTDGVYAATLTIPDTMPLGSAQLQATCPSGLVVASAISITPDTEIPTGGVPASETPGTAVGGVSTTPTGGVAAGRTVDNVLLLGILLALGGTLGLLWRRRLNHSSNDI